MPERAVHRIPGGRDQVRFLARSQSAHRVPVRRPSRDSRLGYRIRGHAHGWRTASVHSLGAGLWRERQRAHSPEGRADLRRGGSEPERSETGGRTSGQRVRADSATTNAETWGSSGRSRAEGGSHAAGRGNAPGREACAATPRQEPRPRRLRHSRRPNRSSSGLQNACTTGAGLRVSASRRSRKHPRD